MTRISNMESVCLLFFGDLVDLSYHKQTPLEKYSSLLDLKDKTGRSCDDRRENQENVFFFSTRNFENNYLLNAKSGYAVRGMVDMPYLGQPNHQRTEV